MKIYLNSKVGSLTECIEKKIRDCKWWLNKYPNSKKWNKRSEKIKKFLKENPDLGLII